MHRIGWTELYGSPQRPASPGGRWAVRVVFVQIQKAGRHRPNADEPRTMLENRAMPTHRRLSSLLLLLSVLLGAPPRGDAQESYPTRFSSQIPEAGPVQEALDWLQANFDAQVEEWMHITEIPAKSGSEAARAAYLVEELEREGIDVFIDEAGNVVARLPGTGGGPTVVFGAHMDTVHPMDTDVSVMRDGRNLRAPGVFDNSASVANMMAAIRALKRTGVRPEVT